MKSNTKIILLSCFYLLVSTAIGQNFNFKATNYIFSSDSLAGFDEDASRKSAMAIRVFGEEYKMYMYYAKREFINTKYNLSDKLIITTNQNAQTTNKGTSITSSSCVNSDFEEASLMTANPVSADLQSVLCVNPDLTLLSL